MPPTTIRFVKPEFTPRSLLRAVWKHKALGAIAGMLAATGGIAIVFRLPPVYEAEALILVDPQKIPERFVTSTVNTDVQDRLATINQEIQSSTHLKKIIDEFGLYAKYRETHTPEEVIEVMRRDIHTVLEKGVGANRPGAFRITYQGSDPNVVAKVVERITNFYIEENYRSRELQAEGTFSFIDNQLRDAKKTLDAQELAVAQYKVQHNGELPQQEASLNAALARLQLQLQGNLDAMNRAQQSKLVLDGSLMAAEAALSSLNRPVERVSRPRAAASDATPQVDAQSAPPVRRRSEDIETQIAALRLRYSQNHPDVRRLEALLETTRRQEREDAANQPPPTAPAPRPSAAPPVEQAEIQPVSDQLSVQRNQLYERITTLKSQIAATEREIQDRRAEHGKILADSTSYQHRIEQLPVRDLEMASLTRNYEFSKAYYNTLLTKKTEAEMATDLEKRQKAETFRVLDPARPPTKPVKPRRSVLSLGCLFLGVGLGIAVAITRELHAGVLLGEWELPAGTVVLARVAYIEPSFSRREEDEPQSGSRKRGQALQRIAGSSSAVLLLGLTIAARFIADRFGNV
jgi:polysaccharide biosynthesis transport protein